MQKGRRFRNQRLGPAGGGMCSTPEGGLQGILNIKAIRRHPKTPSDWL